MNIRLRTRAWFLAAALLCCTATYAQTVTDERSNNTSAYPQFTDIYYDPHIPSNSPCPPPPDHPTMTNGDVQASNVSRVTARELLFDPAIMASPPGTKLLVEFQSWFKHDPANENADHTIKPCASLSVGSTNGHVDIGYTSNLLAKIDAQIAELKARGYGGGLLDWNGPADQFSTTMADNLMKASQDNGFLFGIIIDKQAFINETATASCRDAAAAQIAANQADPVHNPIAVIPACTQRAIFLLNQIVIPNYTSSAAYITDGTRPIIGFFVDGGTQVRRAQIDWNQVHASITGNPLLLGDKVGSFSGYDGAYGWIEDGDTAPGNVFGAKVFYDTAAQNPSKYTIGTVFKGFNDTLASWSLSRKATQKCGQTWLDSWAQTRKYIAAHPALQYVQAVTWDDYEEGTELETGIDNCVQSLNPQIVGNSLTWNPSFGNDPLDGTPGSEKTIHHYTVYAAQSGADQLTLLQDGVTEHLYDLSQAHLSPGNYDIYVKAVGQPNIVNHLSDSRPYVAGANCSVQISRPVNGQPATSPVQVTASATPISGASITTMEIDVDGITAYQTTNASTVDQSVPVASSTHTIVVKATDSLSSQCQSSVGLTVTPPSYQADYDATSAWFNGAFLPDGAIRQDNVDPNAIKPYFSNLASLGLVTDSRHRADVQRWISWYVNHLEAPDRWGITGTIWDYDTSGATETKATHDPDSTDSYAATLLSVADAYYKTGDPAAPPFLQSIKPKIQQVAEVLFNQNQVDSTDHLTWAKPLPTGTVKYLMDNAEVYRGLRDASDLFANAFSDPANAARYDTAASQVQTTLQSQLVNTADGSYYTERDSGGGLGTVAWSAWYATPDQSQIGAVSQLWPIINGVVSPSDPFAKTIWTRFNQSQPCWTARCFQGPGEAFPWVSAAYAAVIMGDTGRADAYIRGIENDYVSTNFAGTGWLGHEAGWFMRVLSALMGGAPPPPPPPPPAVAVTVSSPANNAVVSSPVAINASATSSHTITGWHIYVDGTDSFVQNNVSAISASIVMSAGAHTVIVRAWDSTGAFGDKTITVNVAAGVTVTVTSPATGATVGSPVIINAHATSSHPITGWHIYVNGTDSFSQNDVSSISASVPMTPGTRTVIVRAWDSTGASGDQTLTLNVTAPAVTVTVTSPANNANVSSPAAINASASSSHPITGWHIYVDGADSFAQNNVSSINASVPMSAGTHTVIVRAWDSTGASGDKTLTLTATAPLVTVTVSSPPNNATLNSPATIIASANSTHPITGWHIYVDGTDSFTQNNVSSINASVPMSAGTHTVIVRAWDSTGASGDRTLTLNVTTTAVYVQIQSPTSNTVTGPVDIFAIASSNNPITGWHIYVDGLDAYSQTNASAISTTIPLAMGTHTVIIRAWDSTGASGDQTLILTEQ